MGWSFRKSKSFGPFRLNLSNRGLGFSFGVRGARISVSRRGTYVNLGVNGIYYRQRIDSPNGVERSPSTPVDDSPVKEYTGVHSITTSDVEQVTDTDSRAFVDELEKKDAKLSLFKWCGILPSVVLFFYAFSFAKDVVRTETSYWQVFTINKSNVFVREAPTTESRPILNAIHGNQFFLVNVDSSAAEWVKVYIDGKRAQIGFVRADMGVASRVITSEKSVTRVEEYPLLRYGYAALVALLIAWCIYLWRVDKKRKTIAIYYTLDKEASSLHEKFLHYFREFSSSRKIWQKLHVTGVSDVKYHAGASELVSRIAIGGVSNHKVPTFFLKTNVSIPCLRLRNTELYFFPERLIVKRGKAFGAVFYKNITIERSDVRFIESESVPSDATVIDQTWQYLNKSGGPDRRFNNNRRLPICRYSEYEFRSGGGLLEIIMTSKMGAMDHFAEFLQLIGEFQNRLNG